MKYGFYPIQQTIPFVDLLSEKDCYLAMNRKQELDTEFCDFALESILESKDITLLFMTMAVCMTSKNEMPIVRAYSGKIPADIRGIHRISQQQSLNVAPHFFFDDSRILSYWNRPFDTERLLSNFPVSISIDFSMTNEMGRPQKMYASFLNKLWAAWLQSRGHAVIPNVSFPDEWWEDYWLEGWPKHSIIAISSVGVSHHGNQEGWLKAVDRIHRELNPIHILRYGPLIPGERIENCTFFDNDNKRSANGRK